jgi:hypothetical protein
MMIPFHILGQKETDRGIEFHISRNGLEDPQAKILMFEIDFDDGMHIRPTAAVVVGERVHELRDWSLGEMIDPQRNIIQGGYTLFITTWRYWCPLDQLGPLNLRRMGL